MSRRRGKRSPSTRLKNKPAQLAKLRTAEDGTPMVLCPRCTHHIHPDLLGKEHKLPDGGTCRVRR